MTAARQGGEYHETKYFSCNKKLGKTGGTLDVDCKMGSIDLTIPE